MPDLTPERLFEIRVQRSTARACKTVDAVAVFEAVDDLTAEVTRLRPMEAVLAAARELHKPYGIYDECGHDHTEEDIKAGQAVFVEGDYYSCADGLMYWACTVCCTWRTKDGELYGQSEDCANGGYGHDHDKTDKPICPTRAALDGGA